LKIVIEAWSTIPDDALVNGLERFTAAKATEDLPKYEALLKRLTEGDPKPEPITGLDMEALGYVKEILDTDNEAKHYADRASDKLLLFEVDMAYSISERVSGAYLDLESIETAILESYPQITEEENENG
jgi:hypothetical protein